MRNIGEPVSYNPECSCVTCGDYSHFLHFGRPRMSRSSDYVHTHIDKIEQPTVDDVPYTPDLLVPLYDAPASPEKVGSDGWYRHYSSLIEKGEGSVPICLVLAGKKDFTQLRHEIVSGSPVTATVTFRMIDDALVAQLVSYTAFT